MTDYSKLKSVLINATVSHNGEWEQEHHIYLRFPSRAALRRWFRMKARQQAIAALIAMEGK